MGRSNTATLATTIRLGVINALKELHTSMPGIIESFDPNSVTASIQPAIKRVFITEDGEGKEILVPSDLPLLINVPVVFPRGGGWTLTFPVTKGDECHIIFCERSIDNWYKSGKSKEPTSKRMHSLSDAIAYVGLSSEPNKIPNYIPGTVFLGKEDLSTAMYMNDGGVTIQTESSINLNSDGNITLNGEYVRLIASEEVQVIAPNFDSSTKITSPTIEADTSLKVAGKEQKDHQHNATVDGSLVANLSTGDVGGLSGTQS